MGLLPDLFWDVGLERLPQLLIRLVCAEEASVRHIECLAVVVGVDKPRSDIMLKLTITRRANLAFDRVVYVHADNLDDNAFFGRLDLHIWLAERKEEVAGAGL